METTPLPAGPQLTDSVQVLLTSPEQMSLPLQVHEQRAIEQLPAWQLRVEKPAPAGDQPVLVVTLYARAVRRPEGDLSRVVVTKVGEPAVARPRPKSGHGGHAGRVREIRLRIKELERAAIAMHQQVL